MTITSDTIVAGAGISGLTLAWRLHSSGVNVQVIHREDSPGGAVKTIRKDGWILEAGPNTIVLANTYMQELLNSLGLEDSVMPAAPASSNRYIVRGKKPVPLPAGPVPFMFSKLFTTKAKLRLFKEPFIRPGQNPDESLAAFVERRLGKEFLDYAINPFVAGVYAGNPENLSVRHAFPMLLKLEQKYGSLIKGQFRIKDEDRKPGDIPRSKAPLITFKKGNEELTDTIAQKLSGNIESVFEIKEVIKTKDAKGCTYRIRSSNGAEAVCRNLILTLPLHALGKIKWTNFDEANPGRIPHVEHPPLAVVHLGYKRSDIEHPLDGFGMLVPEKEKMNILGCLFNSSLFEDRTPGPDLTLLTCFVGGSRNPELVSQNDESVFKLATDDLSVLLGAKGKPVFREITRWPDAIPQYTTSYDAVYEQISSIEQKNQGLYLAGNFRNGISVPDCVRNAWMMADKLMTTEKSKPES